MSGVGIVAQGVEEEDIEAGEAFAAVGGDVAVVGEIGAIAEAEAIDDAFPVEGFNGKEVEAGEADGLGFKAVEAEAWAAGFRRGGIEDVLEGTFDDAQGFGGGVDGDLAFLHEVEGPDII